MKYSTFRFHGKTPSETLLVCDKCQTSHWIPLLYPVNVHICSCGNRQRLATIEEKLEALSKLDPLVERREFWERTLYKNWRSKERCQPKALRKLKMRTRKDYD